METIVDRIRMLCVKNKTSITKLEMEFGYANGTIGKWKNAKKRPPLEKVMEIAARLNTTVDYLYKGEEIEKAPTQKGGRMIDDPDDFTYAMSQESPYLSQKSKDQLQAMAKFLREQDKAEKET